MDTLSLILSFIFGAVIGSFLNVVSLRFNTGIGLGGRSMCMSCGTQLTWKELLPIVSFAAQKGSCKKCKSKISWQYPLIEAAAGAVFVLILYFFPPVSMLAAIHTAVYLVTACLLLVITVYDVRHKIIPDQFVYVFALLALANLFISSSDASVTSAAAGALWQMPSYFALLAGPLIALPFAFLWLVSRGRWMGLGDAKLALGIGWLLGISGGVNAVILAFWIAAAVSVIWLFATYRRFKPRTEVPFGPYLILGMYLVLFFRIQVLDVHLLADIIRSYLIYI